MFGSLKQRVEAIRSRAIVDVLADHANDLVHDADAADTLRVQFASQPDLVDLLTLAQQVKEVLVPIEPADEYVAKLQTELAEMHGERAQDVEEARIIPRLRLPSVGSLVAIVAVATSVIGSIVAIVAIVKRIRLNNRQRTAPVI